MRLKDYLKHNNITQKEFAQTVGVIPTTINRYITGVRKPDASTLVKIQKATDGEVTFEDFYADQSA